MWISKKEFDKLKARVEQLEDAASGGGQAVDDEPDITTCTCGTPMIETTTFGTNKQYTCTKCGMKRDMGIEYR